MTLPNALSIMRIAFCICFGASYCRGNIVLAFFMFTCSCISDILDGYIARRLDLVTDTGKLLDPLADKVLIVTGLFCLMYSHGISPLFLSAVVVKDGFLIFGSVICYKKGIVVYSTKYGKASTAFFILGIGAGILGFTYIAVGFLWGALICSGFAGIYYTLYFTNKHFWRLYFNG